MIGSMGKIDYPGLRSETTRHGKTVYYVRRGDGPRTRIHGEPGTREFHAAYRAALDGKPNAVEASTKVKFIPGTIGWAVQRYQCDIAWMEQAETTKSYRRRYLKDLVDKAGMQSMKTLTPEKIQAGLKRRGNEGAPATANKWLKTMRAFLTWAEGADLIRGNPASRVKALDNPSLGFDPWTDDDHDAFERTWPIGTAQRLAYELAIRAGSRRGDLVLLGPGMVRDGILTYCPGKTKNKSNPVEVSFEIDPDLKAAIDATPRYGLTYLCTAQGLTRSAKGFGGWFRDACDKAGIAKGKNAHGIRKHLAQIAAEGSATSSEMQGLFGWKGLKQADNYTKRAERKARAIATSAIIRSYMEARSQTQTQNTDAAPSSNVRRK
jgi:hypothetical protein